MPNDPIMTLLPNLAGLIVAVIALFVALRIRDHQPMPDNIKTANRIAELQKQINVLQGEVIRLEAIVAAQAAELERLKNANLALNDTLASTAIKARASDEQLRNFLIDHSDTARKEHDKTDDVVVLVVITADAGIDLDLTALRAAAQRNNFRITRLYPATIEDLRSKLNRSRAQGTPIKYIHIAAHMGKDGIKLDRIVSVQELSEILSNAGVAILVLNGCDSDTVADYLGIIPVVISMREGIAHGDAALFARIFWEEVVKHNGDGEIALDAALNRVPTNVAEFVELHV